MEPVVRSKSQWDSSKTTIPHDLESTAANTSAKEATVSSPPVGADLRAWIQVVSAFFVFFNTWGLLLAFGALQTYYEQDLLASHSSSAISWIATISGFLLLCSGIFTGPLYDHGYFRTLLICGSLLETLGLMMTSLVSEYHQVFLAQGICVGLGGGMLYVPSMAAAAASFDDAKRPLAIGIVASGAGVGGVIYPIIFRQLQPRLGFPWAVRVMAFVTLFAFLCSYAILPFNPRRSPKVRRFVDQTAFKDASFIVFVVAGFFGAMGYYIPLVYVPTYAEPADATLALYLLAIINGTSTFGRILAGIVAASLGPLEVITLALGCCAILLFSWIAVHGIVGIIVWSVFWGIASSVIVALPGAIIPLLSPSVDVIGTRTGMYWAAAGLGVLVGSPIAGALIGSGPAVPKWWHLQVFAGLSMVVGTMLLVYPMRIVARRRQARNGK